MENPPRRARQEQVGSLGPCQKSILPATMLSLAYRPSYRAACPRQAFVPAQPCSNCRRPAERRGPAAARLPANRIKVARAGWHTAPGVRGCLN